MGLGVPLMDSDRARAELGWEPQHSGIDAFRELLDGMRSGTDFATPPLSRATSGSARLRELFSGIGHRG
jgi:hypothetical protein